MCLLLGSLSDVANNFQILYFVPQLYMSTTDIDQGAVRDWLMCISWGLEVIILACHSKLIDISCGHFTGSHKKQTMHPIVRVFSAVRVMVLFVCVCAVWYVLVRMRENLNSDVCYVVFFYYSFFITVAIICIVRL